MPDICATAAKAPVAHDLIVDPACNEQVVWIGHLIPDFNGYSGEIRVAAKCVPLQMRGNAASAACPNTNVGKVRVVAVR